MNDQGRRNEKKKRKGNILIRRNESETYEQAELIRKKEWGRTDKKERMRHVEWVGIEAGEPEDKGRKGK